MITNVHEMRVLECDTQDFVLTISLDIEPSESGMNFDEGKGKINVQGCASSCNDIGEVAKSLK